MPGAVANNFAQSHARSHDDRVLTEREWEQFGQDLLLRDLARRQYWMGKDRPDLALNLPVKDIQSAHDASFETARIDHNAWRSDERRVGQGCVIHGRLRRSQKTLKKKN